mmetsp:Transcript_54820/g.159951  ORF Transcript_54820/g.159951 Transcript_54820/m.159951 type:complete len:267 (-) Transcript_54820:1032-1832(-)
MAVGPDVAGMPYTTRAAPSTGRGGHCGGPGRGDGVGAGEGGSGEGGDGDPSGERVVPDAVFLGEARPQGLRGWALGAEGPRPRPPRRRPALPQHPRRPGGQVRGLQQSAAPLRLRPLQPQHEGVHRQAPRLVPPATPCCAAAAPAYLAPVGLACLRGHTALVPVRAASVPRAPPRPGRGPGRGGRRPRAAAVHGGAEHAGLRPAAPLRGGGAADGGGEAARLLQAAGARHGQDEHNWPRGPSGGVAPHGIGGPVDGCKGPLPEEGG